MRTVKTILLAVMILMLMAFIVGCTKSSDQKLADAKTDVNVATQDVKNEADQTANAAEMEWLQFKIDSEKRIAENEKIIADYKIKMTNAKGKMAVNYDKKIEVLEKKNLEMKAKLSAYKNEGKESWDKFKTEFSRDMDGLGSSLKNFTVKGN